MRGWRPVVGSAGKLKQRVGAAVARGWYAEVYIRTGSCSPEKLKNFDQCAGYSKVAKSITIWRSFRKGELKSANCKKELLDQVSKRQIHELNKGFVVEANA